jgi:hypothetical protein
MGSDLLFHHRALVVEGLLNALEAERHLRRPLVVELLESLAPFDQEWKPAKETAYRLLTQLDNREAEPLSERDWKTAIGRLRDDIPPASGVPRSGVVLRKSSPSSATVEKKVA